MGDDGGATARFARRAVVINYFNKRFPKRFLAFDVRHVILFPLGRLDFWALIWVDAADSGGRTSDFGPGAV